MPPTPENNYQAGPADAFSRAVWNAVLLSIAQRLSAREALEANFEGLIAEGTQAALDLIQENIGPQIEAAQQTLTDLQATFAEFVGEGTVPNAVQLDGHSAAYYLSLLNATGMLPYNKVTGIDAAIAAAVAGLVNSSPAALDTLKELSDAIGGDASFASTMMTALGQRRVTPALARTITAASSAGDRTLTLADTGRLIVFSGTTDFTVTLSAAATLLNGWNVEVRSEGKCVVTLDPSGAELIDGAATAVILFRQGGTIACDGTGFRIFGKRSSVLLETVTMTAAASVALLPAPGYRTTRFKAFGITMSAAGAEVYTRFSDDLGATFKAATTNYTQQYDWMLGATGSNAYTTVETAVRYIISSASNSVGVHYGFEFEASDLSLVKTRHSWEYRQRSSLTNGGNPVFGRSSGEFLLAAAAAINAIQFVATSGTMSGVIQMWGDE